MRKYTLYAVGEILLVMIGILLALQVNNWNEGRKFSNLKQGYLERLTNDLDQDTMQISALLLRAGNMQKIIKSLTKNLDSSTSFEILAPSVNEYLREGWIILNFTANSNTYSDLSQSGNMNVFGNNDLASLIKGYYTAIDEIDKDIQINKDWIIPMDVNFSQVTAIFEFDPTTKVLFNEENQTLAMENLIKNKDLFMRNAAGHYWFNLSLIRSVSVLKTKATDLILILKKELNKE
jgi:hypothetical protein